MLSHLINKTQVWLCWCYGKPFVYKSKQKKTNTTTKVNVVKTHWHPCLNILEDFKWQELALCQLSGCGCPCVSGIFWISRLSVLLTWKARGLSYQTSASESWATNVFWTKYKEVKISLELEAEKHDCKPGEKRPYWNHGRSAGARWSFHFRVGGGTHVRKAVSGPEAMGSNGGRLLMELRPLVCQQRKELR